MNRAVISGDIIASTSLSDKGRALMETGLNDLMKNLEKDYNVYSRMIKGDYIECVVPEPENSLRIALIIKSYLKSLSGMNISASSGDSRFRWFRIHGLRFAIGYGGLSRFDAEKGIIDGEAIYLSGRAISETATYNKERIVIKNSMLFVSGNEDLNRRLEPMFALIDVLLSKATDRQSEVLCLKLKKFNEENIAKELKIAQPVVNQHSTSVGWNAIEKAVNSFYYMIKELK